MQYCVWECAWYDRKTVSVVLSACDLSWDREKVWGRQVNKDAVRVAVALRLGCSACIAHLPLWIADGHPRPQNDAVQPRRASAPAHAVALFFSGRRLNRLVTVERGSPLLPPGGDVEREKGRVRNSLVRRPPAGIVGRIPRALWRNSTTEAPPFPRSHAA